MFFNKQITQLVIQSPSSSCRSLLRLRRSRWIPPPRVASAPTSKFGSPPKYDAPSIVAKNSQQNTNTAAGRLSEEVYTSTPPSWRAALRRQCVAMVGVCRRRHCRVTGTFPILSLRTSNVNRRSQAKVRSPFLDKYFVYASMLGTHTFFLVFLLMFFFFGRDDLERG